jgi:hypothetical protein
MFFYLINSNLLKCTYLRTVSQPLNDKKKIAALNPITNTVYNTALRVTHSIQFKYVGCTVLPQLYNYN